MHTSHKFFWLGSLMLLLIACRSYRDISQRLDRRESVETIPASPQQRGGDPERGFEYLVTGAHVGNGVPLEAHLKVIGEEPDTILHREGDNGRVPYYNNVFELDSGIKVVSGNCFVCHAARLEGELVLGLGNYARDFTSSLKPPLQAFNFYLRTKYGKHSRTWQLYKEQGEWYKAVAEATVMNNVGINPAFRLEEAAINLRDPRDLTYRAEPWYQLTDPGIGSDVPPLWNVKKKHALYYNGGGRGDFTKLLMQVSVLGIHDSAAARTVQQNFVDVLAWLEALEPPVYPRAVDPKLVAQGRNVFETHCKKCHGTYGETETYPNKLIPMHEIGTDPAYAAYSIQSRLVEWYNGSWYGQSAPKARLVDYYGYIAPPLDGIWATAPYLHNGSVPTLAALLDSRQRPTYWTRDVDNPSYDHERVGWVYDEAENGRGKATYDTTLPGAGNQGHTYGDLLSDDERTAVLAYLKTL